MACSVHYDRLPVLTSEETLAPVYGLISGKLRPDYAGKYRILKQRVTNTVNRGKRSSWDSMS